MMDTLPFTIRGSSPCLRIINPQIALLVTFQQHHCDKVVQVVDTNTDASCVVGGRTDGGFFVFCFYCTLIRRRQNNMSQELEHDQCQTV